MDRDRDPRSEFEDEGIPDLQDGYPEQQWAEDPQQAPLPGEEPMAMDGHGTTEAEQREGEPLDGRLRREEPDVNPEQATPRSGRLVEDDEGVRSDTEKDAVANDVGPDAGGFTAEEEAVRIEDES